MLKFLLILQVGIMLVQSYHPIFDEPPISHLDGDIFTPEFSEIEEIGKQNLISTESDRLSKLKLKSSELFLPSHVLPISYKIKIRPILESSNANEVLTAPGSVEILIRCETRTDSITLHAHNEYVKVFEDSLRVDRKQAENVLTTTTNASNIRVIGHSISKEEDASDFYQIQLSETLVPGDDYVLGIDFLTKISNTSLNGLYLSTYVDSASKEEKFLAVTQFEAIAARRMFPSFDQPDLKSTFQIVISRAQHYNSMSNMPIEFTELDPEFPGYFLDHYPPTPQMSTYLVALVVSEFTCTTAPTFLYNKHVEACGPPHMVAEGGAIHAAQISARILNFYEKLWEVPYPLPKMTSAAIPDFEAGAMEHYGLNTYRISALMYFPGKSSESRRHSIESTIAHELAHQNFGNLVTCKYWNQIFLNEGFATYVAKLGLEEVSPEFESEQFGWYTSYHQEALKADAKSNSHPVVQIDEYLGTFDSISYSKGASLIKMMENILSQRTLMNGLKQYLKTFSFGNTHYGNLFETLELQARAEATHPELDNSFVDIMESWTIQPGFPLVRVEWIYGQLFHISQERFLQPPSVKDGRIGRKEWKLPILKNSNAENRNSSLWHCPIFIASSNLETREAVSDHHQPNLWLNKTESTKTWTSHSAVDWIIVNPDAKAFFRVHYDDKLSQAIEHQLNTNHQVFTPITRAQLIDDGFQCAWAGYNSITLALDRTVFLLRETNPRVWSTAIGHFITIHDMLSEHSEDIVDFTKYMIPRVSHALGDVGLEQPPNDRGLSVFHRASLLYVGARLELPNVLSYGKRLVEMASAEGRELDLNLIPVDIRTEVLCAAVIEGSPTTFNTLLEKYLGKDNDKGVRQLLLGGMGCSRNEKMISGFLANSTNPEFIHSKMDSYNLIRKLATNSFSRSATFTHVRQHFKELLTYFGPETVSKFLLRTFSLYFNTEQRLGQMTELQKEFEAELKPFAESGEINIALIKENIEWMNNHGSGIKDWMRNRVKAEAKK